MASNAISSLIITKSQDLVQQLIPTIAKTLQDMGFPYPIDIDKIKSDIANQLPACLPKAELDRILEIRNNLIGTINTVADSIKILSNPLTKLPPILNATKKSLDIAKTTVSATKIAITAIPPTIPIPGQLIVGLNAADTLVNITLPPIITQTSNTIITISTALNYFSTTVNNLLSILEIIDVYLRNCLQSANLTSVNSYIDDISKKYKNQQEDKNKEVYNGLIIEIIEEPYIPTVNKRKAVAKNT